MLFRELLGPFGSMRKLFGVFLSHFENSTEFSVLFSVLFPEKLRIWENSRILGVGNSSGSALLPQPPLVVPRAVPSVENAPNFGSFSGAEVSPDRNFSRIREISGSFFGAFSELPP